jgi:transcriptional regulator with XRE-family HTH domain
MTINKLTETRLKIAERLRDIMKQKCMNQSKIALKAGVKRDAVRWLLRGEKEPTLNTFIKILNALDSEIEIKD